MMEPDLPITPPIREALQSRRKDACSGGTESGGAGLDGLEHLEGRFGGNGLGVVVDEECAVFREEERKKGKKGKKGEGACNYRYRIRKSDIITAF